MRPAIGLDVHLGKPLKSGPTVAASNSTASGSSPATSTTFFLAREAKLEGNMSQSGMPEPKDQTPKDSSYGVESMADTIYTQAPDDDKENRQSAELPSTRSKSFVSTSQPLNTLNPSPSHAQNESPSVSQPRRMSRSAASQPLTPLFLPSPVPGSSAPESPKSFSTRSLRHSDSESAIDETGSQALVSGGEDDDEAQSSPENSAPQLIMPSIKMPSRRPFTEKGKNMGRLKVLIAGRSGMSKETCEI